MKQLIPNQFLFRFAYPCKHRPQPKAVRPLGDDCRLPFMGGMDNAAEFGTLRAAWSDAGLTFEWWVPNKKEPPYGEPERPNACDGLTVWLDMRDTRTIHRASRFCFQFHFLADDGGAEHRPGVAQRPINRALEDALTADVQKIALERRKLDDDGFPVSESGKSATRSYWMQVHLPAAALPGFDPELNSRLGFAARLRDREHGDMLWAPGPEFPYWEDPSLWGVLELAK